MAANPALPFVVWAVAFTALPFLNVFLPFHTALFWLGIAAALCALSLPHTPAHRWWDTGGVVWCCVWLLAWRGAEAGVCGLALCVLAVTGAVEGQGKGQWKTHRHHELDLARFALTVLALCDTFHRFLAARGDTRPSLLSPPPLPPSLPASLVVAPAFTFLSGFLSRPRHTTTTHVHVAMGSSARTYTRHLAAFATSRLLCLPLSLAIIAATASPSPALAPYLSRLLAPDSPLLSVSSHPGWYLMCLFLLRLSVPFWAVFRFPFLTALLASHACCHVVTVNGGVLFHRLFLHLPFFVAGLCTSPAFLRALARPPLPSLSALALALAFAAWGACAVLGVGGGLLPAGGEVWPPRRVAGTPAASLPWRVAFHPVGLLFALAFFSASSLLPARSSLAIRGRFTAATCVVHEGIALLLVVLGVPMQPSRGDDHPVTVATASACCAVLVAYATTSSAVQIALRPLLRPDLAWLVAERKPHHDASTSGGLWQEVMLLLQPSSSGAKYSAVQPLPPTNSVVVAAGEEEEGGEGKGRDEPPADQPEAKGDKARATQGPSELPHWVRLFLNRPTNIVAMVGVPAMLLALAVLHSEQADNTKLCSLGQTASASSWDMWCDAQGGCKNSASKRDLTPTSSVVSVQDPFPGLACFVTFTSELHSKAMGQEFVFRGNVRLQQATASLPQWQPTLVVAMRFMGAQWEEMESHTQPLVPQLDASVPFELRRGWVSGASMVGVGVCVVNERNAYGRAASFVVEGMHLLTSGCQESDPWGMLALVVGLVGFAALLARGVREAQEDAVVE